MRHFIIIDSYNFLFKAYYALPAMQDRNNNPVGGIYGFCSILMRYLADHDIDYIALACDSAGPSFRHGIYEQYKNNRPEAPADIKLQFPILRDAFKAFGLKYIEMQQYEADDIIASLVKQYASDQVKLVIFSSDKDLMQLVGDNVSMFDSVKNQYITSVEVENKFGIEPVLIADYLALCGDASDNVPGIPGIGPKTAALLLKQYGSLDGILNNIESITPVSRREKVRLNVSKARISYRLVTLKNDLVTDYELEDFTYSKPEKSTLFEFFDKHSFHSLKNRAIKVLFAQNNHNEHIVNECCSVEDWHQSVPFLKKVACLNTKTGLLLYSDENKAILIDVKEAQNLYMELVNADHILKLGYNLKAFEADFVSYDDLMLMSYSIYTNKQELPVLIERELGKVDADKLGDFELARSMLELHSVLSTKLLKHRCQSIYFYFELPLVKVVKTMEAHGVKVSRKFLTCLSNEYTEKLKLLEKEIFELVGHQFNLGSPKQLAQVLFEELSLPKIDPKSNSTNQEVLEVLQSMGHMIATKLLEWRHYNKLINTYTDPLIKHINVDTGRVHTCYNLAATSTGRLSSSNPNLQNIPIRNTDQIRRCFIAEESCLLIAADYSQIELRLLAHIAEIQEMQIALDRGEDIHVTTASTIFGIAKQDVTRELRRKAKAINFGIIYGITPYGLSRQLKVPIHQAEIYIREYLKKYPGIESYMNKIKCYVRNHGYVKTIFGRCCIIDHIKSSKATLRNFAERAAINAPIQGSAADIMKLALIELDKRCKSAKIVMQIHDEFVLEVKHDEADYNAELVRSIMESVIVIPKLKVDVTKGVNLASLVAL